MFGKDIRYDFSLLKFVKACLVGQHTIYSGGRLCALLKNVYFGAVGWNVLFMSVRFIWAIVLFRSAVPLLIFCLDDLSNIEGGLLKFPAIIVLLFISPFSCALIIQVLQCWLPIYSQWLHPLDELTPLSLYGDPLCLL